LRSVRPWPASAAGRRRVLGRVSGVDLEIGFLASWCDRRRARSIRGTLAASLIVALIDTLSKSLFPEISLFAISCC